MATTLNSQLQAIRSFIQVESEPPRRPLTRPSVLFDPREAADIGLDTILSNALLGLEALIVLDERFKNYKNALFSHKSRDLDRELMGIEENNLLNLSISSYLQLLSGHFQLPSALKTLEYLIRRYKIYFYNAEELILCALPYHDTHAFVRIMQIIDTGNSKWKFLDGVKLSGAPPPRMVIVQQCIRDAGVLDALCVYASPSKKCHPSKPVISFCIALVLEILGSISSVDNGFVVRVFPFLSSGINSGAKGDQDHKAGALMIITLLSNKATLSQKLVKHFVVSIAGIAQGNSKELSDFQWLRISFMALINIIQLQSLEILPKKALKALVEIRDFPVILNGLAKEFNIDKFLWSLMESLVLFCFTEDWCYHALTTIIESILVKGSIDRMIFKLLNACSKLSENFSDSKSSHTGSVAKQILLATNKNYPSELRVAVQKFMENTSMHLEEGSTFDNLCKMLDDNFGNGSEISDSKIWLALEHPKAEVRCVALSNLDAYEISKDRFSNSQRLVSIQDVILRRLHDEDLTVVQAALSLKCLLRTINSQHLLVALKNVLQRCVHHLASGLQHFTSLICDVGILCLEIAISAFKDQSDCRKYVATLMFPLLLILPKYERLNIMALKLSKDLCWPMYSSLPNVPNEDKKMDFGCIQSFNFDTVCSLTTSLSMHPEDYLPWIIDCCYCSELSKSLVFLVLMQSFINQRTADISKFCLLLESLLPVLKSLWETIGSTGDAFSAGEFNEQMLDWDCKLHLDRLLQTNVKDFNAIMVVCLFWKLIEALLTTESVANSLGYASMWVSTFDGLFVFFAESNPKRIFEKHLHHFIIGCKISPVSNLTKFFTGESFSVAVQVEGLHCFSYLSSQTEVTFYFELLAEFPAILVSLSSDNQDVRVAAIECIDALLTLCPHVNDFNNKGNNAVWCHFIYGLLAAVIQQKKLIISDKNFLPSFLTSLLSCSYHSLLVPVDIEQRFDQSTKQDILHFILGSANKMTTYAKLKIFSSLKAMGCAIMNIQDVESLLFELLRRRREYHFKLNKSNDTSSHKLSFLEVELLCILLEISATPSSSGAFVIEDSLLNALQLDNITSEDPAIILPCITVLQKLSRPLYSGLEAKIQAKVFHELVYLFRNSDGSIQNATREALLRINITSATLCQILDEVLNQGIFLVDLTHRKNKKKQRKRKNLDLHLDLFSTREKGVSFLSSLLDILLLKKDIENRASIIKPLYKLLGNLFGKELLGLVTPSDQMYFQDSSGISQTSPGTVYYIQHMGLLVLQDIFASLTDSQKNDIVNDFDVELLIECLHSTKDAVTRNHVFSLLSTIAKVYPEKLLDHIVNILAVIGESAVTQLDHHSQRVFEDLISELVPCWLSQTDSIDNLLQIFMKVLPNVAEHRRVSIIIFLIRTLGEASSLGPLLVLLFHSLVSRLCCSQDHNIFNSDFFTSSVNKLWEYSFAFELCNQFSCKIWLPSLVSLLLQIRIGVQSQGMFLESLFVMHFINKMLQGPEFTFKLESVGDADCVQKLLGDLMKQVVHHLQFFSSKLDVHSFYKRELNVCIRSVLRTITHVLQPSVYYDCILNLVVHPDRNINEKALGILCETLKDHGLIKRKHGRKELSSNLNSRLLHLDDESQKSFENLCMEIVHLVDDDMDASLKLIAVSTLEVLAIKYPNSSVFLSCLSSVSKNIDSQNLAISSSSLQTAGALINVLESGALPELPHIINNVLKRSREGFSCKDLISKHSDKNMKLISKESYMLSCLLTLEAIIIHLSGFLNPYLKDIVELLVLHVSTSDLKLKSKADDIRRLVTEKITVRLMLPSLLDVYSDAVKFGDSSLSVAFEMLANLINSMDKLSVGGYHSRIFDLCLQALDLRHQHPISVKNIHIVETIVVNTIIALTMKLTETMFKPLFIKSIEWAGLNDEQRKSTGNFNTDRALSFYVLVNALAESHRSLFVPYFKYFFEDCVWHLNNVEDFKAVSLTRSKKRAKLPTTVSSISEGKQIHSLEKWHLRALVLSALHKCFLFDTGSQKFLDSNNFQVLLKPIISQLAVEAPPTSMENVPSVDEVDDLLVSCIGQMAIACGNDLLWKSLNHEVLMQTRSESVRTQVASLRIVGFLVENLNEEYMALLAETIPFLAELLENSEASVKSLAQQVFRQMETISGENLQQYL